MATIQGLGFKTSVFTGTTRPPSTGESLAKLLLSGVQATDKILRMSAEEEARLRAEEARKTRENRIARNELDRDAKELSVLATEDAKRDIVNRVREIKKDNNGNINSEQYNEAITESTEYFSGAVGVMSAEDYGNLENFRGSHKDKAIEMFRVENTARDTTIMKRATDFNTFQNIDTLEIIRDGTINGYSKDKAFTDLSVSAVDALKSGGFKGQTSAQLYSDPRIKEIFGGIKNDKFLNPIREEIKNINKETVKAQYEGNLQDIGSSEKINYNKIAILAEQNGSTMRKVEADVIAASKETTENVVRANPNSPAIMKEAVRRSVRDGFKITAVEKNIGTILNNISVNEDNAFNSYSSVSTALAEGYIPKADMKDFLTIQGVANDYNIAITKGADLATVKAIIDADKDSGVTDTLNMKTFLAADAIKDNFGYDDYISDETEQRELFRLAKKYPRVMSVDARIKAAMVEYKQNVFGDNDGQSISDWRGVPSIKNKADVGIVTEYLKDEHSVLNPKIQKFGETFIITGEYKDGSPTNVSVVTQQQMEATVTARKEEKKEQDRKMSMIKKNEALFQKSKLEELPKKHANALIMKYIASKESSVVTNMFSVLSFDDKEKYQAMYNDIWSGNNESFNKFRADNPELIDSIAKEIEKNGAGKTYFDMMPTNQIEDVNNRSKLELKAKKVIDSKSNKVKSDIQALQANREAQTNHAKLLSSLKDSGELDGMSIILDDETIGSLLIVESKDVTPTMKRNVIKYEDYISKYGAR